MDAPEAGAIGWVDLTVGDAPALRDFYRAVAGWGVHEVGMGDYADYAMTGPGGAPVAGVCHARGVNADLPPVWLIYVTVSDLEVAMAACRERGGAVVSGPREMGGGRLAVIRDPAGAHAALWQVTG